MKSLYMSVVVSLLFLTACGGGSSSSSSVIEEMEESSNIKSADLSSLEKVLTNMGVIVDKTFNSQQIKIFSTKKLSEMEEISQSTVAVYGVIDEIATKSLLKINTNYKESNITVAIYENNKLVGQSESIFLGEESSIDFGLINTVK